MNAKMKRLGGLLVLLAVASILIFWFRTNRKPPGVPHDAAQVAPAAELKSESPLQARPTNGPQKTMGAASQTVAQAVTNFPQRFLSDADVAYKNSRVDFWGMVVDQDDKPLSQVRVVMKLREWYATATGGLDAKFQKLEMTTDSFGRFTINGRSGDSLTLESLSKEGYFLPSNSERNFFYREGSSQFIPDYTSPVVYRLWKILPSEALHKFDKDMRIPYDGTPVRFDLITGQRMPDGSVGGDLKVSLTREPRVLKSRSNARFDWQIVIEAIGGGLQQADKRFWYSAPDAGYRNKIMLASKAAEPGWTPIKQINLFGNFRQGKIYSRIELEFRMDSLQEQTGFTLKFVSNPNGSRNLQP